MRGQVYFVSAPGRVKIGYTCRPERRLKDLQKTDMEALSVIAIVDGSRFLEKTLHRVLAAHRLRGEWFTDCAEVRAEIESAKAGKYPLSDDSGDAAPAVVDPPRSVEFQVVDRLCDGAEAAIARGADKHEVRGHVRAVLAAVDAYIVQRGITPEMLREV